MKYKKLLYWLPVLAIMITIFCFSSQNADNSSQTSGGFAEFLARIICPDFDGKNETYRLKLLDSCQFAVRKAAHFSIYALMGFLSFNAFRQYEKIPKQQFFSALLCLSYSISDEIHQSFVPGRSCELRDVLIDLSGAVSGIIFLTLCLWLYQKYKARKGA